MLAKSLVDEIVQLLEEGELSQRRIAKKVGVSRGTVNAIATGKRGDYGREDSESVPPAPTRCTGCNHLISGRCVACDARAYQKRQSRAGVAASASARGSEMFDLDPSLESAAAEAMLSRSTTRRPTSPGESEAEAMGSIREIRVDDIVAASEAA